MAEHLTFSQSSDPTNFGTTDFGTADLVYESQDGLFRVFLAPVFPGHSFAVSYYRDGDPVHIEVLRDA